MFFIQNIVESYLFLPISLRGLKSYRCPYSVNSQTVRAFLSLSPAAASSITEEQGADEDGGNDAGQIRG